MTINIQTLFADMLPDPLAEQRAEGAALASIIKQGGNVAAYYQPQREATLRTSAGGLFGIDTSTGTERLREAAKGIDPNSPTDLIQLAQVADTINPEQGIALRAAAAQLTDKQEQEERTRIEKAQQDSEYALRRATSLENLTSAVQTREEVEKRRTANETLIDNSEFLSPTEKTNYKGLIKSGAFDNKQAELLKITNPAPLIFGNNAVIKDNNGEWKSIVSTPANRSAGGLESIARLSFDENDPKRAAVIKAIQAGEITTMTQLNSVLPKEKERAEIPKQVADVYKDTSEIARSAFIANSRIDNLIKTIEEENLLNYTTGGVISTARSATLKILGERDEIEFLRTAYVRERNTEIVNSLPKGTASDRDIAIFSAGFPPEDATIEEVYKYLQAAKNINNLNQEYNDLLGMYINTQADQGVTPTAVGFDAEFKKYVKASNVLKANVADIQAMKQPSEEDIARIKRSLQVFEDTYGKLPIDLY